LKERLTMNTALTLSIGSLCGRPAVYVHPDSSLRSVSATLASELIGVAVVGTPERLMGIVGERDVVRALGEGADPDVERARDVMTEDVLQVPPDASVLDVARLMRHHDIRHVVVTGGGRFHVVSARDLMPPLVDGPVAEA
jgi:CBS domain-containing protein